MSSPTRAELPRPETSEAQPLLVHIERLAEALEAMGSPLSDATARQIKLLKLETDDARVVAGVQELLDPICVAAVEVDKDGAVRATAATNPELVQGGWRSLLVKVINRAGSRGTLRVDSTSARALPQSPAGEVDRRWMGLSVFSGRPLGPTLSGAALEYRVIQLYSRDAGERRAELSFGVDEPGAPDSRQVRSWRFETDADGWSAGNNIRLTPAGGRLVTEGTGTDPYMSATVKGGRGEMVLRFLAGAESGGLGEVFWWTEQRPNPDGAHLATFAIAAGQDKEYEVRFIADGDLTGVRIDPGNLPQKVAFDWISLERVGEGGASSAIIPVTFRCLPSAVVTFRVQDDRGRPTTASFEVRDDRGRVYPDQAKRLAPDLSFQPQVYRADGETVSLPPGRYTIDCRRGPESIPERRTLEVGEAPVVFHYRVKRWVDPARDGWYSGDHHIHAAGCLHYESPTQGVQPSDMVRHCVGEDLKVGCCLTWGPCFDYQKQFFSGGVDGASRDPHLLRYDIEVSGFGSHQSGHLVLLNLKEQVYPGGASKDHWPTLGLNTLRWAKAQGAVTGPAHSAIGLTGFVGRTEGQDGPGGLPNFNLPAYDGIGANEYIVDVTHEVPGPDGTAVPAVDFISAMDTDRVAEWNMWYHTLNCGLRTRVSGETDFPCITGDRVGQGRVYVKVDGRLGFDRWVRGLAEGRSYVSDGAVHLMDFSANPPGWGNHLGVGDKGSDIQLDRPATVRFTARVSARLEGAPVVPVELVVNAYPAARQTIVADGTPHEIDFAVEIDRSSWVALRVFPHAHTNPFFIRVGGRPIRGPKASAEWCLKGVDQCWSQKQRTYAPAEFAEAQAAYDHARDFYRRILDEP